jgi:hypothetical protein
MNYAATLAHAKKVATAADDAKRLSDPAGWLRDRKDTGCATEATATAGRWCDD